MKTFRYLYGPVPSRRLGRSLGIDLVPYKICTYNCIYCQIGKTTRKTLTREEYAPVTDILDEVDLFLKEETSSIDYLSLAGSGEPTLHSKIRTVIERIKKITSIPVAVITNGSLLYLEEVGQDLLEADVVLPSLDAVSQEAFSKINRPKEGLFAEKVVEGLEKFRKIYKGQIWLEILFCRGVNDGQDELSAIKEAVERIRPDKIHLNTVVRPPSEQWALPLDEAEMKRIRDFFGENAEIISEFYRDPSSAMERDIKEEVLKILKRRPLSISDLSEGLGIPEEELDRHLKPLTQERKVQIRIFSDSIYYEIKG
ncbi:MAG: radical SAM protein [Deltaproteobacteria bacterium]|nr:radical SAM protein [Deltaproteobacteria bacterium]MBM4351984.1 radical SAM protein [Deltaproteobacteria bacterium]